MQEQAPPERTLSIREAAHYFGLGETTIRRRIQSGELRGFKQTTPYGLEWRIIIPGGEGAATGGGGTSTSGGENTTSELLPQNEATADGGGGSTGGAASDHVALALVEENRRLQEQALQLAGRIGWLESQLQQAQEQLHLLTDSQHAPDQPAPEAEPTAQAAEQPAKRRWWQRLFGPI